MLFIIEFHGFQGFRITVNSEKVVITLFFVSIMAFAQTMAELFASASAGINQQKGMEIVARMFDDMMTDIKKHGREGLAEEVNNALFTAAKEKMGDVFSKLSAALDANQSTMQSKGETK